MIPELVDQFGSVPKAMLTLFMAITGGNDWSVYFDPVLQFSRITAICFLLYIGLMLFAILNVITGIFVECTTKNAAADSAHTMAVAFDEEDSTIKKDLKELLDGCVTHQGRLSFADVRDCLCEDSVQQQIHSLGLHVGKVLGLFKLLDRDGTDTVEINEFIAGCVRCGCGRKGAPREVDVMTLLYENKALHRRIFSLETNIGQRFRTLEVILRGLAAEQPSIREQTKGKKPYANIEVDKLGTANDKNEQVEVRT